MPRLEFAERADADAVPFVPNVNAFDAYVARLNTAQEMVYNPFSGNSVRTTSQQIAALQNLGFGIVDSKIVVNDAAQLKHVARRLAAEPPRTREAREAIAPECPRRMRSMLLSMLTDGPADNVATRLAGFLAQSYDALKHARAMSVIGALDAEDIETVNELNEGQSRVLALAESGHNLFIAGVAGTGKTELIKRIRVLLQSKRLSVGMTATTGLAATNIGGVTFHSFVGLSRTGEVRRLKKLKTLDTLIVDEVSMLDYTAIARLDTTLRELRGDGRPFGGLQIIFAGDPLQLESIAPRDQVKLGDGRTAEVSRKRRGAPTHRLFFEAPVFREHVLCVALTQQVRQANDTSFTEGLNQLRSGVWPSIFDSIITHVPEGAPPAEDAMLLLARNADVAKVNADKLAELQTEAVAFEPLPQPASLTGSWTRSLVLQVPDDFDGNACVDNVYLTLQQRISTLRPADVVGYRYLEDGFVLRVRLPEGDAKTAKAIADRFGSIVAAMDAVCAQPVKVLDVNGDGSTLVPPEVEEVFTAMLRDHPVATRLELKEGAKVMLRQNFTNRLINGSTGVVTGFVPATLDNVSTAITAAMPSVVAALEEYATQQQRMHGITCPVMPVVKFPSVPHPIAIPPVPITVGGCALTEYFEAASIAVPLSLAYASTIHKAQGMTLRCPVRICMERMWACNHIVYVAMSRARAASQITVSGFKPELVRVNPAAAAFDANVPGASDFALAPEERVGAERAEWYTRVERVASAASSFADTAAESPVVRRKRAEAQRDAEEGAGNSAMSSALKHAARGDHAAEAKKLRSKRLAAAKAAAQGAEALDPPLMMKR